MLIRITLTDADRERLGCGVLDYDPSLVMVDEAEVVQDDGGIDPGDWPASQNLWLRAIGKGFRALESGEQRTALRAERALVWIALRRAGIRLSLPDLSYNRVGLRVDFPDVDGQGKDPSSTPPDASPTGEPA